MAGRGTVRGVRSGPVEGGDDSLAHRRELEDLKVDVGEGSDEERAPVEVVCEAGPE